MQYFRKLNNVNPAAGTYLSINIPKELSHIFETNLVLVEPLSDGRGISIKPARVEAI